MTLAMGVSAAQQVCADILWQAWQTGQTVGNFPVHLLPPDRQAAYAVQSLLGKRSKKTPVGWKIAATSLAGQQHIGVDRPLAGRLLAERVHTAPTIVSLRGNRMRVAEPEFVFAMATTLPPRSALYSVNEVMHAVAGLYLGIEVPNARYADYAVAGDVQLIADNACAHEFILGPAAPALWRSLDLASHVVSASVSGKVQQYSRQGDGSNVLGSPCLALTWLVNELSSLGHSLVQGQIVTTGTCMRPLEVEAGDSVRADFGMLGAMQVRFAA